MAHHLCLPMIPLFFLLLFPALPLQAQEEKSQETKDVQKFVQRVGELIQEVAGKRFARKGVTELGGSIGFYSVTPVYNGKTQNASTNLSFAPYIGYFIADGFELGVNPLGINVASSGFGFSSTSFNVYLAPSYNFDTGGNAFPFLEALIGYTGVSSESGLSWGGRGGVKMAVGANALLNFAAQYLMVTMNTSGAKERNGYNTFSFTAGFTIWL